MATAGEAPCTTKIREWIPPANPGQRAASVSDVDDSLSFLSDDSTAGVLAEINRLQESKANWGATLLILLVSGVLFYLIGSAAWNWKTVALLIPILLFHELGHYLAMLAFGYRNLRMFFIPLFGAAVTGRNYNVAAWKKAVVSLMGPVPGIGVGIALGITAYVMGQNLLLEAAALMVFINGINLLPILPLDGGWNLHRARLLAALRIGRRIPIRGGPAVGLGRPLFTSTFFCISVRRCCSACRWNIAARRSSAVFDANASRRACSIRRPFRKRRPAESFRNSMPHIPSE